jgi:hypothetical protein
MQYEGLIVVRRRGDRDRVGDVCTVTNVQPDGKCEFHGSIDYCHGHVREIALTPSEHNNKDYVLKENWK